MPSEVALIPSAIVRDALEDFAREVVQRREVSKVDPVADGMAYVVRDLTERVARAERSVQPLTPEQFAELPRIRVTPQAVTRWCRAGELPGAYRGERGWLIPRDAKRTTARAPRRRIRQAA